MILRDFLHVILFIYGIRFQIPFCYYSLYADLHQSQIQMIIRIPLSKKRSQFREYENKQSQSPALYPQEYLDYGFYLYNTIPPIPRIYLFLVIHYWYPYGKGSLYMESIWESYFSKPMFILSRGTLSFYELIC